MLIKSKVLTEKSLTEKHFRQTDISLDLSLKIVRRSTDKCSFISIFALILKLLLKITLTFSVKYFCRRNLRKAFLLAKAAAKTVKTTEQICRQTTSSRTPSDIYRKNLKMSPGAYLRREIFVSKSIRLALQLEGNLPFLVCLSLYLSCNFQVKAPRGAYIWRGDLTEGFLRYEFGGLIFREAYFRNFTILICPYLSVLTLNGNNGVLGLVSHMRC